MSSSFSTPVRNFKQNVRKNRSGSNSHPLHYNNLVTATSPTNASRKARSNSLGGNPTASHNSGPHFTFTPVGFEDDVDDLLTPIEGFTLDDIKDLTNGGCPSSPTSCSSSSSSTHSYESSTPTSGKGQKATIYDKIKDPRYKTELCKTYEEKGECPYGSYCLYAHGYPELRKRERHNKYKTELCWRFHSLGLCPYGDRCTFIHSISPLKTGGRQSACDRGSSKFEAFLLELAPS